MRTLRRRGFTLIELLVVIAIIGLLSTLAVVALSSARLKARDAKRVSDIKQIQTALDLYATDKNGYPGPATPLILGSTAAKCLGGGGFATSAACIATVYMPQVPAHPLPPSGAYTYNGLTCSGTSPVCTNYTLDFVLEADTGELKDDPAEPENTVPNCRATPGGITCI